MPEPVIIKVGADLSELTAKLDSLQSQFDEFKGAAKQSGEAVKQAFTGQAVSATKDLSKSMDGVKMSAKQLDAEIRAVNESIKKTNDPKAIAALKEYRQELIAEESQLGKTTQKFESMRGKIMAIKNELFKLRAEGKQGTVRFQELTTELGRLGDMKDDINELGKALSSDTRHIDGMIQGVQGLVGAFSIFQGVQMLVGSENKEFQQAMLKMMATMQILNGVQQVANILQKESAFIQTLKAAGLKLETLLMGQSSAATILNTSATKADTIATEANTAAKTASKGIIGLIIVAIAALACGAYKLAKANSEAEASQRRFNEAIKDADNLTNKLKSSMDEYIHMRKIQGASEEELIDLQINKLQEFVIIQQSELKKQLWNVKGLNDAERKEIDKKIANYKNLTLKEQMELTKQFGNMQNLTNDQKEEFKKRGDALKDANDEILKLERDKEQLYANQNKEAERLRIENTKKGLEKEIALIKLDEKEKLAAAGTNETLRKEIISEANRLIREATKKHNDELKKIREEDERKRQEELVKRLERVKKFEEDMLKWKKAFNEKLKQLPDFDAENFKNKLNEQKQYNDGVLELENSSTADREKALKSNAELLYIEEFNNAKSLRNRKNAWDKYQQTLKEIDKNISSERIDSITKEVEQWGGVLNQAMSIFVQFQNQYVDEQLKKIGNSYDLNAEKYKSMLDKKEITQEQYDKKIKALNDKKEREEKALKHKQFETERAAKLIEATGNLALAISQAYAKDFTGIMAGINAVLIGAQIALISSQKNPYRKGTAQILGGQSHEGGGVDLGGFGTAEKGEMIGILNKHKTKKFGKPMMDLFDGINKGNDSKMLKGLSGLVISAMPEIKQGNQVVNVPKQPELGQMLDIMRQPTETVTIQGNRKIIKKGNYTKIVHI